MKMTSPIEPQDALFACKVKFIDRINGRLKVSGRFHNLIPELILKNPKVLRQTQQKYVEVGWEVSVTEDGDLTLLKVEHPSLVDDDS